MINKKYESSEIPLSIKDVSKHFKSKHVLDKVNLKVKPGEIYGLIGLNGVGKTTMIKIILDLLKAENGQVHFFGNDNRLPYSRRKICYLPEKFYPSPYLKGHEFLSLSLAHYNMKYDSSKARKLAEILELDKNVLVHKISKYSKGMSQKLGLVSVFMSEAPLLILDEPMSGLDPSARIELKELLLDYVKKGNSIFFSSHILSDIEEICDTIAILNNKEIIYEGDPREFRNQYGNTTLERAFLKSINKDKVKTELLTTSKKVVKTKATSDNDDSPAKAKPKKDTKTAKNTKAKKPAKK